MNAFILEGPILAKIQEFVSEYLTDKGIAADIVYLDFEPSEGFIDAMDLDGAVCVYASEIGFKPGEGSTTGTQDSTNLINVDVYGYGDPLKDVGLPWESTLREAQNRAEILTTLSYKAIQDRTEIENEFGTGLEFSHKYPQSININIY